MAMCDDRPNRSTSQQGARANADGAGVGLVRSCKRAWLAGAVVFLVACARQGPFSADQSMATREVNELIPKGTSEAQAMKRLSARGFQLSRHSTDQAPNHLIVGSCAKDDFFWQVGLVVIDAKVAATGVKVSDTRVSPK